MTVSIACADTDEAGRIADLLVGQNLAACVQSAPIRSTYVWQGGVETADEVRLTAKTLRGRLEALEAAVKAAHSYEVPEIIATRIDWVSTDYENWLRDSLKP
ncbi:divalent-cation tolerance protein CutA [Asticcacaulis sp. AND118]|uniref:divalent-cation tolerance protein CutA n=1 Tax=Asticcacaulis sp. AND118 TaxID=2840468 RepID=UPI001CFF8205|nr:divalent-cation tolerance protein CutA [Asticcacaulis sp. AND118]UDF03357.1 divalent-cation tolerance protein CutA [Asticcacaulis sp. AND118]